MIKNAFCLCLKLFSFLHSFFCPDFFGHAGKRLNINANVISKINYTSHIPQWNLVSSEKNHTQNAVEKLVLDRLKKSQNWEIEHVSGLTTWKVEDYQNIKLRCWPLAFRDHPYIYDDLTRWGREILKFNMFLRILSFLN